MGFNIGSGVGSDSGGSLAIREGLYFTDLAERNAYPIANLVDEDVCAVGTNPTTRQFYQWRASVWTEITPVLQGQRGVTGEKGDKGDKGDTGAKITSASFVGDDVLFTLEDNSTSTLLGAKNTLKGDKGDTGAKVATVSFVNDDIVFTLDDSSQVTLVDAKTALVGDTGANVTSAAFVGDDIVFTLSNATTVTLPEAKTALRGLKGDNAPIMQLQFSTDGTTDWSDTLNPAIHLYWRWSTDNGVTWSPDSIPYRAATGGGAGLTPQQEVDLAANTAARHEHTNKAILDATTGTFTLARQEKLDGVQDTFKGTFPNAAAIEAAWPTPLDGWAVWNTETATVWSATGGVWADTLATSVGDMLKATYDPQGVSGDAFARANHTGEQAISTVTGLQAELDKLPVMQLEIDTLDTQLNAPTVGLVAGVEGLNDQVNNATTGIIKRLADVEFDIDDPTTGILKRLADVETGGATITGAATTIVTDDLTANRVAISSSTGKVAVSGVSVADLTSINSAVTPNNTATISDIDGIVTNKSGNMMQVAATRFFGYIMGKLTGAVTTVLTSNLASNRALVSDGTGKIAVSAVTSTELGFLDGVTSNVQTQINGITPPIYGVNRALGTGSTGKVEVATTTLAELNNIRGGVTNSNQVIDDADRFVHNDAGTMRQTAFSNVWTWIKAKASGAVSTVLTANLSTNKVLISDGSGKIAVSTVTSSELAALKPYVYIGGGSYSSKTLTVCSGLRDFTVWFAVTSSAISLKIKNSATGNITANGVISSGGEGSSDGGGWYEDIAKGDYTIESLSKGQISDSSNNASKAGLVLFSVKNSASTRHIALHYVMHNTDADEFAVYCRAE